MKRPLDGFNACDDFFVLVVKSHVLAATMQLLVMTDVTEIPSSPQFPGLQDVWMDPAESRKKLLHSICLQVIDEFVDFRFNLPDGGNEAVDPESKDGVLAYAKGILALGCFYLEYSDGIREGDGERVLRCWRYMLPMFHSSRRNNYALESLYLLFQHDFSLSPRQAIELIWSRFVNVHGLPGKNIPNDLHMEHLNRLLKVALQGLGANKTEKAITTSAKALGVVDPVLSTFDKENHVSNISGSHRVADAKKDMEMLLKQLSAVFRETPGRLHKSFKNPRNPLHYKTIEEIKDFIKTHINL